MNHKLRLIQCGVGGMGRTWWKTATSNSPDFELAAIVDVLDAPLQECASQLNLAPQQLFKSLEDALAHVEADAVLTVTPPPVHVEHARLAFERGLHVLTEKPIAHDLASAKLMVELARRAGRQLVVAQNYRYSAPMQCLKSVVQQHLAGELGHGHIDFYIPADFTGSFRESMQFPLLVDMSIHHLDLIRAVTGRNIAKVTATTFNPPWSWYRHHAGLKMLLDSKAASPSATAATGARSGDPRAGTARGGCNAPMVRSTWMMTGLPWRDANDGARTPRSSPSRSRRWR
jgi:predicted dehydrogenase